MVLATIWRIAFAANAATGSATVGMAEVEMRATAGGADQCTGGSASAGGGTAANAVDNNTATEWSTSDTFALDWQYDFASAVEVRQLVITGCATAAKSPNSFTLKFYDGAGFQDALVVSGLTWTATETKTFAVPMIDALADTIALAETDALAWRWAVAAADTLHASYLLNCTKAVPVTLSQGVGAHAALVPARGQVLLEHLTMRMTQIANSKSQLSITDAALIASQLLQARPVTLTSGVGVALAQVAQLSLQIIEDLGLLPALTPIFKYHKTMSEAVGTADALTRFLGGHLADTVGVALTQVAVAARSGWISEGIGVAAAVSPRLILRVTAHDSLTLDDASILRAIYRGTIADGIELAAAYLSPGDGVTTWAMNTRNGAVTEYSNFAFNSFAQIGKRYVAASSSGLYELLGDDDDGTDIIATIKSGFAQWAGSKFAIIKGIYLGVRGEGDFVLRVTTGDGKTYNYAVSTRDVRTTKVHTGKGLKARYFAFELISTGQDFDLDTIEFVPLAADRRV